MASTQQAGVLVDTPEGHAGPASLGPAAVNDHPEIRRVFEGFALIPLQIRYTVGREGRDQAAGELIIKSWNDRQAQLL